MDEKPKRRWLRYSLRTLLVLVTIACAAFGWLGWKARAKQEEREAVKAIQELGGTVFYDYEYENGMVWRRKPPGPAWLRNLFGDDFYTNVAAVHYSGNGSDTELSYVLAFNHLRELHLERTGVTDAGLIQLRELTKLKVLGLDNTKVTDAGVLELQKLLPNLTIIR